jgi:hypothetical protein
MKGFPPLSPARGERGTGGERGHVIAAKYQNLAEQGKSGEMTFLQWTHLSFYHKRKGLTT